MPAEWLKTPEGAPASSGAFSSGDPPLAVLELHPHRSLTAKGFVWFFGATLVMIAVPLIAVLGTPVLWGLLPFFALALWGLWAAIERNRRDRARLTERLTLWRDRIEILRTEPDGGERHWHADPYWVRLSLRAEGGPVEDYLTLSGGGREVELGAFLAPGERADLYRELSRVIALVRGA